jgi:hypothetical protein
LYQHWIHSFEEDEKDKKLTVYRPSRFNFPPARGREGFEIKRNGIFIWHPISPLDGNDTIEETWKLKDHKIMITGKENKEFKIIELTKDKLIISKLN